MNARMPVGIHATSPLAIARVAAQMRQPISHALRDRLTDEDIEELTDQADAAARTDALDDMRHTLRVLWNEALAALGGLNPPKLPVVANGQVVKLSFPEVLSLCGETNHLYVLLADVLRGANADVLHIHLRSAYVDGYAEQLVEAGWQE